MNGAWLWAHKAVVRRIRAQIPDVTSALATYYALCETASDGASDEFNASVEDISAKSGLSARTTTDRIKDLEGIKAVDVVRPKVKAPARFKLLNATGTDRRTVTKTDAQPLPNDKQPLPNDRQHHTQPLPIPNTEEKNYRGAGGKPRPLGTGDRIGFERQAEELEREVRRLSSLRHHEQESGHPGRLNLKRAQLAKIKARLAEGVEAIA